MRVITALLFVMAVCPLGPVRADVRRTEGVDLGDTVTVQLRIDV